MSENYSSSDSGNELVISLDNGAKLDLQAVDIDAEGLPLEFSIDGVIRDVDSEVISEMKGYNLEPIAIRFRLLSDDE